MSHRGRWRWPILLLAGLEGCLYVGGVNHPPEEGALVIDRDPVLRVGSKVVARVDGSKDPDGDEIRYDWLVRVVQADGRTYTVSEYGHPAELEPGDTGAPFAHDPALPLTLPLLGAYSIEVHVKDTYGATQLLRQDFTVENNPPVLDEIRVARDPLAVGDRVPDHDGKNPIHAHYYAFVPAFSLSADPHTLDLEGDLSCDHPVTWEWSMVPAGAGAMEYTVTQLKEKCDALHPQNVLSSQFFFRFAPSVQQPVELTLTARATDRFGAASTKSKVLKLRPNRPPCIEATEPSHQNSTVVVLQTEERRFEATSVSEDVIADLRCAWLVRDQGEAGFSALPEQTGQALVLPAGFRPPGARMELRLIVEEDGGAPLSCKPDEVTCASGVNLPTACYQWVTWSVVFQ